MLVTEIQRPNARPGANVKDATNSSALGARRSNPQSVVEGVEPHLVLHVCTHEVRQNQAAASRG